MGEGGEGMSLVKKTIVLSENGIKGHITVVRIGSSVGAKVILVEEIDGGTLYLKVGSSPTTQHIIKGKRLEIALNQTPLNQNDDIGGIIIYKNKLYAAGGIYKNIHVDWTHQEKEQESSVEESCADFASDILEEEEAEQVKRPEIQDYPKKEEEKQRIFEFTGENYKENNFYIKQKNKFDEIFTIYPVNKELEEHIDDSKWVTVNYDGEDYYVVGLLTSNNTVTHIVYGVPGLSGIYPPPETLEISDWLPTPTRENPKKGYWLIFQDAMTGNITKI